MSIAAPNALLAGANENDHLQLTINPTERCNLRCHYCYESFTLGRMSPDTAEAVVALVRRRARAGLKRMTLDFFGGEPLAAWEILEPIAAGIFGVCRTYSVALSAGMTTNAVLLTQERLDRLVETDVRTLQITLDGPEDVHDKRRIGPHGEGSHAAVTAALRRIKASNHDLTVTLRLHFDPTTLARMLGPTGSVAETVREFVADDPRFRLLFYSISKLGGPNDDRITRFASNAELRAAIGQLREAALAAGAAVEQMHPYTKEAAPVSSTPYVCYAAKPNAFVIRSDGSLSKCTVALDDKRNSIGRLSGDGELIVDEHRQAPWTRGQRSGDPRELGCPAVGFIEKLTPA